MSRHLFKCPHTKTAATTSTSILPITETTSRKEVLDNSNNITCPLALATYDEVVANPCLFRHTLEKLHDSMGTKFMVPTLGGKALDLHRLFVEVTARGGLAIVTRDRKWREVFSVLNLPSTITSASFTLRKYYISLLQHYEQIYFFQKQDQLLFANASTTGTNIASAAANMHVPAAMPSTHENQANDPASAQPGTGCSVIGIIDGKFNNGYLITVTIGSKKLKGLLFHAPVEPPPVSHGSDIAAVRCCNQKKSSRALDDPSNEKEVDQEKGIKVEEQYQN